MGPRLVITRPSLFFVMSGRAIIAKTALRGKAPRIWSDITASGYTIIR